MSRLKQLGLAALYMTIIVVLTVDTVKHLRGVHH